jgi:hypothetical protein
MFKSAEKRLQRAEIGRDGCDLLLHRAILDGLHELRRVGLGGVLAALLAPIRELPRRVIIELAAKDGDPREVGLDP